MDEGLEYIHVYIVNISIAGRIMNRRIMGNASFAELQDSQGRIQIYLRRDDICPGEDKSLYNKVFKKLLDIGDIIGIEGNMFKTKVDEDLVKVLFDQAVLSEGGQIKEPAEFVKRMNKLMLG